MSEQKHNQIEAAEVTDEELSQVSGGDPNVPKVTQDGQGTGYTDLRK